MPCSAHGTETLLPSAAIRRKSLEECSGDYCWQLARRALYTPTLPTCPTGVFVPQRQHFVLTPPASGAAHVSEAACAGWSALRAYVTPAYSVLAALIDMRSYTRAMREPSPTMLIDRAAGVAVRW